MSSPSLIDKDVTYCNAFNIGWVNINFFPDGQMEIESLADKEECNFPFRQKIRDVFAEKGVGYDNTYAEEVVGSFVKELETTEVKRVDV